MAKETGEFEHKGIKFLYTSELVETFYGPENKVCIRSESGNVTANYSECMKTQMILDMFKKQYDEF